MDNNKVKNNDKFLNHISQKYNLNLSQIEKVEANGKKYIKFTDPKTNEIKMFEDLGNKSITNEFSAEQNLYSFAKTRDDNANISNAVDFRLRHDSDALEFVNITELINNYGSFEKQLDSMDLDQKKVFRYLIVHRQDLHVEKINLKTNVALDKNNQVISTEINPATKEISSKYADVSKVENKKEVIDMNNETNYENMEASNNEDLNQVVIDGEIINIKLFYDYPELLEQQYQDGLIDANKKQKINEIIEMYKNKQLKQNMHKPKILEFTNNNYEKKAGFLDVILLSVIVFVFMVLMIFISIGIVGY